MTSDRRATRVELKSPYLIFLGDEPEQTHAKTGIGIAHWRPELCIGQKRLPGCGVDLGLPDMSPAEAHAAGARSIIWGVAGVGGIIPEHWTPILFEAVEAGLDIGCGRTFIIVRNTRACRGCQQKGHCPGGYQDAAAESAGR